MIDIQELNISLPGFSVRNISLEVGKGEFFTLLGPTGSGKSLVLESIAGLVRPSSGRIQVGGRDVTRLSPEKRHVGIVYQDDALFPHMTVKENIEYGLKFCRRSRTEAYKHVGHLVDLLGLSRLTDRLPKNLSGGEKQRVALARALAVRPEVLLLDEPLSALDPNFRDEIRRALKRLHQEMGVTFFMVTHDFAEAMFLADKVAIINMGQLEQVGTCREAFQKPATEFVAKFVGMKNVFPASFQGEEAQFGELFCPLGGGAKNGEKYIALRPEDISLRRDAAFPSSYVFFQGRVEKILNSGFYFEVGVRCKDIDFLVYVDRRIFLERAIGESESIYLGFDGSLVHAF